MSQQQLNPYDFGYVFQLEKVLKPTKSKALESKTKIENLST